jgi:hypothetical protein
MSNKIVIHCKNTNTNTDQRNHNPNYTPNKNRNNNSATGIEHQIIFKTAFELLEVQRRKDQFDLRVPQT